MPVFGKKRKKVWRYLCLQRPPGPGAIPREGLIECQNMAMRAPSGWDAWGWADYDRPLTPKETDRYELEFWMETERKA